MCVHSSKHQLFTRFLTINQQPLCSQYMPRCALQQPLSLVMMLLISSEEVKKHHKIEKKNMIIHRENQHMSDEQIQ